MTDCTQEALKEAKQQEDAEFYFIFVWLGFFVVTLIRKIEVIVIWGKIQSLRFIPVLLIGNDAENDACL